MNQDVRIVSITAENIENEGFFCYKSKPKSAGYRQKLGWMKARLAEGLRLKILYEGKRSFAFIEYLPAEYGWRAVDAPDYMLIHCLWVVGKGKGRGFGSHLLNLCIDEARQMDKAGVAMVASSGHWLVSGPILLKNGFELIDRAPPSFELLVKRFDEKSPLPTFPQDWGARLQACGPGLTVQRTDQCPYNELVTDIALETAADRGIPARVERLDSAQEVQTRAPSPYGTFALVLDGELLSYHYQTRDQMMAHFDRLGK